MPLSPAVFLIPLLPFAGFAANFLFLRRSRRGAPLVALAAVGLSLVLSLWIAAGVLASPAARTLQTPWLAVSGPLPGGFAISVGALVDPLSALLLVVVTLVSFLVHLYSLGYMREDPGLPRFFLYLGLFTFSMLGLVLSPNFFQMYIFWELVGLCSYLLIGFYVDKPEANQAAKKAFVVNRVGDFGFFLGIVALTAYLGTADFAHVPAMVGRWPLYGPAWLPLGAVALLLFGGAVGKSAQFPLHVWLPDAMEGPTPVSALIHAATMVAAGVFLVARAYSVFDAALMGSVDAPLVVAWIGGFTSIFAATIACTQHDIKRVLAYSTLSQLGYMVLALGAGGLGVTAGVFHLFTHAFFKALLFLGAGSVIHAVHSNDLRAMGGLRRRMPVTGITFLVACLAISAIPPFAGFFSKDMILDALRQAHLTALYTVAAGVSFLTAFYIFRLYFLAFEGEPAPADGHGGHGAAHAHESPGTMTAPLLVLGLLSCVAGFAGLSWGGKSFGSYIRFDRPASLAADWTRATALASAHPDARGHLALADALWAGPESAEPAAAPPAPEPSRAFTLDLSVSIPATLLGLAGLFLAYAVYRRRWLPAERLAAAFGPVHTLVQRKYYVYEAYRWALDHLYYVLSAGIAWFDRHVVDGFMNALAWASQAGGAGARRLQTGRVQAYALAMLAGLLLLLASLKVLL